MLDKNKINYIDQYSILEREEENLKITNEKFGHFSATPSIYYVEKGKVKDSLCSDKEKVNLENYKKFLIENGIIEEE